MKLKAVLNRDGGTFRTMDMDVYAEKMRQVFSDAGHHIDIAGVKGDEVVRELKRAAYEDGIDGLVAGGGDGTISSAAEIAWQAGIPLGVIPAGTMNLFARALKLPPDVWAVLDVLAHGNVAQTDIGSVNGKAFVHQFSAGIHARMVRYRNQLAYQSRAGKIAANMRASIGALLNPPSFEIEFDVDGHRERRTVSAISVSNNPFGDNGLMIADDVTTGHLGFYIADPLTPKDAFRLAADILRGKLKENPAITAMQGKAVDLSFPKLSRSANYVLDGELMPLTRNIAIRLHPGALKVIVPEGQGT